MEYIVPSIEIITISTNEVISASIEIELGENELPIDKYTFI